MAVKLVDVPEVGQVSLYKRRGVRGIKMSITHDGTVRITLPMWAPYKLGIDFARNKIDWIHDTRKPKTPIRDGDRVGKAHRFTFVRSTGGRVSSKIRGTDIFLAVPLGADSNSPEIQKVAENAALRALKKEAEQLLPMRLQTIAESHGFIYNDVSVKRLKSRWGSCNERKEIVFNLFLMQLPWHLIDYVILHELVHTKVLRHGRPFWSELEKYVTDLGGIRKEMKAHQPTLVTVPSNSTDNPYQKSLEVMVETA